MEVDPSPGSPAPAPVFSPLAPNHLLTSLTTPTLEQVESHFKPSFSAPIEWLNSVIAQAQAGAKDQDQDEEVASLTELKTLYERNLWHNLTIKVEKYVDGHVAPAGQSNGRAGVDQVEMFKSFIRPIHSKLNPLKYVELAKKVVRSCQDPSITLGLLLYAFIPLRDPMVFPTTINPVTRKESTLPAATSLETQAYALSLSSLAYAYLLNGEQEKSKQRLDECDKIVKELDVVEPVVMGGYYSVAADYYKVKADYVPFYKSSLLFLACINVETDLNSAEKISKAHDLAIAALLGESIYNFGELLQHPILSSLDNTEFDWLKRMLFVFNAGDIGKYEMLSQKLAEAPILASDADFLRQKICLMALIEAVFKRPRDERSMSFQTIAQETKLPIPEVEHLVMKALSLNLIKGSLDQVNNVANIHWVQPRVLDQQQTESLARQLDAWCSKVGNVGDLVGTYKQPFTAIA